MIYSLIEQLVKDQIEYFAPQNCVNLKVTQKECVSNIPSSFKRFIENNYIKEFYLTNLPHWKEVKIILSSGSILISDSNVKNNPLNKIYDENGILHSVSTVINYENKKGRMYWINSDDKIKFINIFNMIKELLYDCMGDLKPFYLDK
jgi:hypothetical protein